MRKKHKHLTFPRVFAPVLRRRKWVTGLGASAGIPVVTADDMARLKERYEIRNEQDVVLYLRQHPYLVDVLLEASDVIPQFFWQGIKLLVEVYTDHEYPTDRRLNAIIKPPRERSREAYACLGKLDWDWWLDTKRDKAKNMMSIMLE